MWKIWQVFLLFSFFFGTYLKSYILSNSWMGIMFVIITHFPFSRIHYNTHLISMHNGPPECNSPTCLNDFMTNLSIYLHFYPHFFLSRIYYYYSNSIGEKSVSLDMTFFCHFQGSLRILFTYITYGNIIYSAQLW